MLTVIAEIRTRPGQHHRQAVLDQFAKIIPTVLSRKVTVRCMPAMAAPALTRPKNTVQAA